ncbi:MAG: hypothetical protein PHP97_03190 [Candidatus Shapirobacteria bacterium]|nr:hypothetical protein [Candidatus Shapirobacteria bacterium]MDD4383023.1 hypothetical protein [Candidatus Shapirobacteria bacterium]
MENTNNLDTNIPQPTESPIIFPTPKKINIFKYLFFISVAALLTVIISFYFILKNKNSKVNQIQSNNNIVQQTPDNNTVKSITETPTNTQEKTISYQAKSVEDDTNSVSKLILVDQNNKEKIITEDKYLDDENGTVNKTLTKVSYSNFIFSSDNKYLFYDTNYGYEYGTSFLYDIKNNQIVKIGFLATNAGFTSNLKYFYSCAQSGMSAGGILIKQLPSLENEFIRSGGEDSYNCNYINNKITFSGLKENDPATVVSQYEFSEDSGSILKIK